MKNLKYLSVLIFLFSASLLNGQTPTKILLKDTFGTGFDEFNLEDNGETLKFTFQDKTGTRDSFYFTDGVLNWEITSVSNPTLAKNVIHSGILSLSIGGNIPRFGATFDDYYTIHFKKSPVLTYNDFSILRTSSRPKGVVLDSSNTGLDCDEYRLAIYDSTFSNQEKVLVQYVYQGVTEIKPLTDRGSYYDVVIDRDVNDLASDSFQYFLFTSPLTSGVLNGGSYDTSSIKLLAVNSHSPHFSTAYFEPPISDYTISSTGFYCEEDSVSVQIVNNGHADSIWLNYSHLGFSNQINDKIAIDDSIKLTVPSFDEATVGFYITYRAGANCQTVQHDSVEITQRIVPSIVSPITSESYCFDPNNNRNITPSISYSANSGTEITATFTGDAAPNYSGPTTATTTFEINTPFTNSSNQTQTLIVKLDGELNGCYSEDLEADTLFFYPQIAPPQLSFTDSVLCNSEMHSMQLSDPSGISEAEYNHRFILDTYTTQSSVSLESIDSSNNSNWLIEARNNANANRTLDLFVQSKGYGGCRSLPTQYKKTVIKLPTLSSSFNDSTLICNDDQFSLQISSNLSSTDLNWTVTDLSSGVLTGIPTTGSDKSNYTFTETIGNPASGNINAFSIQTTGSKYNCNSEDTLEHLIKVLPANIATSFSFSSVEFCSDERIELSLDNDLDAEYKDFFSYSFDLPSSFLSGNLDRQGSIGSGPSHFYYDSLENVSASSGNASYQFTSEYDDGQAKCSYGDVISPVITVKPWVTFQTPFFKEYHDEVCTNAGAFYIIAKSPSVLSYTWIVDADEVVITQEDIHRGQTALLNFKKAGNTSIRIVGNSNDFCQDTADFVVTVKPETISSFYVSKFANAPADILGASVYDFDGIQWGRYFLSSDTIDKEEYDPKYQSITLDNFDANSNFYYATITKDACTSTAFLNYNQTYIASIIDLDTKPFVGPNPALNDITLFTNGIALNPIDVNVINSLGLKQVVEYKTGIGKIQLNTSTLTPGSYFIHIHTDEYTGTLKFIKQ